MFAAEKITAAPGRTDENEHLIGITQAMAATVLVKWGFPKLGLPYFGPYDNGILLFGDLYWGSPIFVPPPDGPLVGDSDHPGVLHRQAGAIRGTSYVCRSSKNSLRLTFGFPCPECLRQPRWSWQTGHSAFSSTGGQGALVVTRVREV